ncbi:MAG: Smr/MutS family protein [Acidobacteriota bacterium]
MTQPEDLEPSVASPATLEAVELPSLLRLVAELAATDSGRRRLLELRPTGDREMLADRRQAFEDARRLLAERRLVPFLDLSVEDLLERLRTDIPPFGGEELVDLADVLRAAVEAAERIRAADPPLAAFRGRAEELEDLSSLVRDVHAKLDKKGAVRDDASPQLTRLRQQIRGARDQVYNQLGTYVGDHDDHLSESTVPMRGGRLVVMLQAGSRGRLPGLVHGRSGSGRSFYFEPLEVVEANNTLQQAVEDEEEERARILRDLLAEARRRRPAVEAHAALLTDLDVQQAAFRFAEQVEGRLVDLAERHDLHLAGARHPLLDPRLAELRERALGQAGHGGEVVPLELTMSPELRSLVLTGPNAGGKTVALKTLGLLVLANQCALPVPAASGSRLPVLRRVVATVGDEQDLMRDRSTFSGRLLRLEEAWQAASPDSLLLLDELGSGTDPAEGSALSTALLEGVTRAGSLALVTTHLAPVAAEAMELEGAGCAAMEFDGETGQPTFRLRPGPPGGSEALALARRLGLPAEWLDRAEARLDPEHRDLRRLIAEMETLKREAEEARDEARQRSDEVAAERQALEEARLSLEAERRGVARRSRAELEDFRRETLANLRRETETIRQQFEAGRRKNLEVEATQRLFEDAPEIEVPPSGDGAAPEVGDTVRHTAFGWQGVLEKLSGDRAELSVKGKRVRCRLKELERVAPKKSPKKLRGLRKRTAAAGGASDFAGSEVNGELKLLGSRVEPALEELDRYLDRALLAGRSEVRIVHGHGTGRLRDAVREHLRRHPAVNGQRSGGRREGGDGATVAVLRGA